MESKALLSTSICLSCVLEHPQKPSILVFWGVIRQYKTLLPLLRKRNSYLPQNCFGSSASPAEVTDIVNIPLCVSQSRNFGPFLWSDSILHILGEVGNGTQDAHGEVCCSEDFLFICGQQKQYLYEQMLQVKETSLTIVRKISRHIVSCEC